VNLPQRRDRIYEAYPLLRPAGREPLVPSQYLAIVGRAGMLPDFEAALVAMSLVFAHRLATAGSDARVSVPLSDEAIADRSFLRRLDALVEDHGPVARRVVLEISQRACDGAGPGFEVLARLRERGVAFGLTKVKDLNLNPPALARLGVRFVKIRSDRLVAAIEAGPSGSDLVTLIDALSRSTIDVIADAVEDEVIVPELLDAGVPLAQGLALALPCPAEAVLERSPRRPSTELQAGAPIAPRRPEDPGPSGPQGSLRDFLRRAG
jgi:EAL domain-containing protein (putative c-di-GMP-specific phosphodiesterase class I)